VTPAVHRPPRPGDVDRRRAPTRRRHWIDRPTLHHRLDEPWDVALLVAPPGFGRSTLLATWAAQRDEPLAWVHGGGASHDAGRLAADVVASLALLPPGRGTLVVTDADRTVLREIGPLLAEVAAGHPGVRVALTTQHRVEPPRGAARPLHLTTSSLAFTAVETTALLRRVLGREPPPGTAEAITEAVGGWPALVAMAADTLSHAPDPHARAQAFTAGDEGVVEYVAEVVLAGLPADQRDLLLATAVLSDLYPDLVDHVLGRDARRALAALRRTALLVETSEGPRVLSEPLRTALRTRASWDRTVPLEVVRHRAAEWYAAHGREGDALHHLLAAGDEAAAGELVARGWDTALHAGRGADVAAWLHVLGEDRTRTDPRLALAACWVGAATGDRRLLVRHRPALTHADPTTPDPAFGDVGTGTALLRATFGFEGVSVMRSAGEQGRALADERWQPAARLAHALALLLEGEYAAARRVLGPGTRTPSDQPLVRVATAAVRTILLSETGRSRAARRQVGHAWDEVVARGLAGHPQASLLMLARGHALAHDGRPADARPWLERAVSVREHWGG
jgi:LuxR family maltose regulon positive regulatory protein